MSPDEFDILVNLIEELIAVKLAMDEHPHDAPRQRTLADQKERAIEAAKRELVL